MITDIDMLGLSGIEFLLAVRGMRINLLIIVISGRGDANKLAKIKNVGATVILPKPFDPHKLEDSDIFGEQEQL